MNAGRRAYDILRGYLGREWDRIQGVERDLAEAELNRAMEAEAHRASRATPEAADETLFHYVADKPAAARRLLGVRENASFDEIRSKFVRLNKRCHPDNFPEGSQAREQAEQIQKRLYWAYQALTEDFDSTEKRFRSLELD